MPFVRRLRSLISLVLVGSTAIGGIWPVRACTCPPAKLRASVELSTVVEDRQVQQHCCCPPGAVKADCCCRDRCKSSVTASPKPTLPGCPCDICDCGDSDRTPIAPPQNDFSNSMTCISAPDVALVPPAFLPLPAEFRSACWVNADQHLPADLFSVLSRLIC